MLRELNQDISEVDEREWNRDLVCCYEIRQFPTGDPFHDSFYQFCPVVCAPANLRTISLTENFLHPFQEANHSETRVCEGLVFLQHYWAYFGFVNRGKYLFHFHYLEDDIHKLLCIRQHL